MPCYYTLIMLNTKLLRILQSRIALSAAMTARIFLHANQVIFQFEWYRALKKGNYIIFFEKLNNNNKLLSSELNGVSGEGEGVNV